MTAIVVISLLLVVCSWCIVYFLVARLAVHSAFLLHHRTWMLTLNMKIVVVIVFCHMVILCAVYVDRFEVTNTSLIVSSSLYWHYHVYIFASAIWVWGCRIDSLHFQVLVSFGFVYICLYLSRGCLDFRWVILSLVVFWFSFASTCQVIDREDRLQYNL